MKYPSLIINPILKMLVIMENNLWFLAALLIIVWGIGLIGFGMSSYIHILLVLAFVAIILRLEDPIFRTKQ